MSQRTEVHIHIHEGASPDSVAAAVRAAVDSGNGAVASITKGADQKDDEQQRVYWERAYKESEGEATPLIKFLVDNPERLIPYPEVSKHLGFASPRSLPGLLGAFGRRAAHRYKGTWPFERKLVGDEYHLYMSKEAADAIRSVI